MKTVRRYVEGHVTPSNYLTDTWLLLIHCQRQPAHDLSHLRQGLFGLPVFAQDHEVIRIGDDSTAKTSLQSQFLPRQHEPPHVQIRQQR